MTIELFWQPNTFAGYLELAHESKWSGRIDINAIENQNRHWSIYFLNGQLVWCTGGEHWRRRWRRLLFQYCLHIPNHKQINYQDKCADYYQLKQWVERGLLMIGGAKALVQSNLVEVLFDILQQESKTVSLNFETDETDKLISYLPPVDFQKTLNYSQSNWKDWCEADLGHFSPNYAPTLSQKQQSQLRQQVSLQLYQDLVGAIDGEKSLRDVALLLRQPLLSVALSLNILFQQGLTQMYVISDLSSDAKSAPLSPNFKIDIEDLLSNAGVICSKCGCGSNSAIARACTRCGSSLNTKALPPKPRFNISFFMLIPILILLLLVGVRYFASPSLQVGFSGLISKICIQNK